MTEAEWMMDDWEATKVVLGVEFKLSNEGLWYSLGGAVIGRFTKSNRNWTLTQDGYSDTFSSCKEAMQNAS